MEFLELLDNYGYSVEDCAVVTLGTDGLDPNFSNLVCVSILPVMGDAAPQTIYVEGADIYSSAPYTRVNETTYQIESISRKLARERLYDILKDYKILIGHNAAGFTQDFLCTFDKRYREHILLDTWILARYYYQQCPDIVGKSPTLPRYQKAIARLDFDGHRRWRLEDLCQFDPGDYYNIPERNAVRTKTLFIYLLGREAPIPRDLC